MLNHIVIMGRLTHDPEMRRTASGLACSNFSLAVERDIPNKETGSRETDFIDCVAWRATAEFVSKFFSKGSMAVVSGRLQIRLWEDKNGNKRRTAEVVADNIYFGSSKKDAPTGHGLYGDSPAPDFGGYSTASAPDFAMLEDEDAQLPF